MEGPLAPYVKALERIFQLKLATSLNKRIQQLACLSSCVPPLLVVNINRFGSINPMSIGYAFCGLALGSD